MNAELASRVFSRPDYFLAMGLGAGLSPRAPGTAGSVVALLLFIPLSLLPLLLQLSIIGVGLVGGVYLCDRVATHMSVKDPSAIVWDEFIGMWISLLFVPLVWYWWILAFVMFRIFDVLKPWPVSWADRELEGGMGIMCDDVIAGVFALASTHLVIWLYGAGIAGGWF